MPIKDSIIPCRYINKFIFIGSKSFIYSGTKPTQNSVLINLSIPNQKNTTPRPILKIIWVYFILKMGMPGFEPGSTGPKPVMIDQATLHRDAIFFFKL